MVKGVKYVIGISGGSGSGKTCFLNELANHFSREEVCILSQDNYYVPKEQQLIDENGIKNFDLPGSIDDDLMIADVRSLKNGQVVEKMEYVFNNDQKKAGKVTVNPAPILLIEGLFIYHYKALQEHFDFKLFVEAPGNTKLIRRIKRDQKERNYPVDDVLYRYENHVNPSFEKYILPYRDDCDVIINNRYSYVNGVDMVKCFIRSKLLTI
mgnify:CR=1 FL=1